MSLLWDSDFIKVESYYIIFLILQCMFWSQANLGFNSCSETFIYNFNNMFFLHLQNMDIHFYLMRLGLHIYIHTYIYAYMCVRVLVTQSCLTLCNPVDYSPPGSSVCGILQARILEGVAILFSRGSSQPRDQTHISWMAGGMSHQGSWASAQMLLWISEHRSPSPCTLPKSVTHIFTPNESGPLEIKSTLL